MTCEPVLDRLGFALYHDWKVAPVDFVVAVNIAGQLHDQIRDLPPGTTISEIKFEQP